MWHVVSEQQKKCLNSLVVLGAWVLWTHRNSCVFDGAAPSIARALNATSEERRLWEIAGAQSLFLDYTGTFALEWPGCLVFVVVFLCLAGENVI